MIKTRFAIVLAIAAVLLLAAMAWAERSGGSDSYSRAIAAGMID